MSVIDKAILIAQVKEIQEQNPQALFLGGTEMQYALIGYVRVEADSIPLALYDVELIIKILQHRDGMTEEEALEWYEHNILGSYMGPNTPVFFPYGLIEDPEQSFHLERADGTFVPKKIKIFSFREEGGTEYGNIKGV